MRVKTSIEFAIIIFVTIPPYPLFEKLQAAQLPALPQALLQLLALCQSDDVGMHELTAVIATEPALSARLLKVANSAAYHRGGAPLNLQQAANTLGTDMIKVLAISESVVQTLGAFKAGQSMDLKAFWKHSLSVALLAKALALLAQPALADQAYLTGLLHDVGRLALLVCAPEQVKAHFLAADDADLCAIEQQSLGFSHAQAGAWLLTQWHLAEPMVQAVAAHHPAGVALDALTPLTQWLVLAEQLSVWTPASAEDLPELNAPAPFDAETLRQLVEDAQHQVSRTAQDLGLDISESAPAMPTELQPTATDPAHLQLALEVQHRALLSEMSLQLARQPTAHGLLGAVREHAALLLELDDVLVLLLGEDGHTLSCVSVSARHYDLAVLTLDSRQHPVLQHCLQQHSLSMANDQIEANASLCHKLGTHQLVAVPLFTAKAVQGVLLGAIAPAQLTRLQSESRFLLAFGLRAGVALARQLDGAATLDAHIARLKREQLISARQLAHEVQNPLSIIQNYLSVLERKLDPSLPEHAEVAVISDEVQRVGHIIEQFSQGKEAHVLAPMDLAQVVRELVLLLQASRFFPEHIQLQCSWPASTSWVLGSSDMVKQILINLIKNARESLPEGGLIGISGGTRVDHAGQRYVLLSVRDSGPGLSAYQQSHMFEPVASAKTGAHRGLGLSVVNELVKKMNGQIRYLSSPKGVRFEVLLPAAER